MLVAPLGSGSAGNAFYFESDGTSIIVDAGFGAYLDAVRETLAKQFGRRSKRVDATLRAALDFHFWRALAPLGDAEAAGKALRKDAEAGHETSHSCKGVMSKPASVRTLRTASFS